MPSSDEELAIIARAKTGDNDAVRWLMKKHAGMIHRQINRRVRYGFDADDAESYALESLWRVIRRFNASKGISFITLLTRSIERHTRRSDRGGCVYVPCAAWRERTTRAAMIRAAKARSLCHSKEDGDWPLFRIPAKISDEGDGQHWFNEEMFFGLLSFLDERRRRVVYARFHGFVFKEIAKNFGLSVERIRQYQRQGLDKINELLDQPGLAIPEVDQWQMNRLQEWLDTLPRKAVPGSASGFRMKPRKVKKV